MLRRIGPVELTLILVIVIMLFGVGKLPEVFGSVGRGIREFRRNSTDAIDSGEDKPAEPTTGATTSSTTSEANPTS
jgi:sec-independent protein translocase protein TatA